MGAASDHRRKEKGGSLLQNGSSFPPSSCKKQPDKNSIDSILSLWLPPKKTHMNNTHTGAPTEVSGPTADSAPVF
jgi:hypothetical protein